MAHARLPCMDALEFWLGFAVLAALKLMLPPGMSPELALTWARHVVDAALMTPRASRVSTAA